MEFTTAEQYLQQIKADLTPLAPLPYQGMGENISPRIVGEGIGSENENINIPPLLAGEGLGERSLPTWNDELYLEFHRGCYTTHADQKRWNRRCEDLLYEAELFATLATVSCGAIYPKAEIETAWKQVLFNQFHDILPGSSITQVYQDALPEWQQVEQVGTKILQESFLAIASQHSTPTPASSSTTNIYF